MFGRSVTLFKLLGFEIKIDFSWLILAALITWSLASGLFPEYYKDLPASTYWWMGVAGAAGLFLSIVLHELAHSVVARNYGINMRGITLFIFGGVAEMGSDPPSPRAEFFMAIVGPLSSGAIGLFFLFMIYWSALLGWPVAVSGVLAYLAWLNIVLAVFNLLPAFPLDGGRVLRCVLWKWKNNLRWATAIASRVGSGLGLALLIAGIILILFGNFVAGLWWFMIGLFIRTAAQRSYQQLLARGVFQSKKVKDFMVSEPVAVSRALSLEEFVRDYVYRYHYQMYPVLSFGKVAGCVSVNQITSIPRDEWSRQTVGAIVKPCDENTSIGPDADANEALEIMNKTGNSRLMVVDGDDLLGIVTLKDMLAFLSIKMELEKNEKDG
ncbi:MAG TPA: CBS domain-containing protein [Deltaproteobacteria bacterium]|nr:CBS domain-containing protein [Deltaproteobacteria bacterium]